MFPCESTWGRYAMRHPKQDAWPFASQLGGDRLELWFQARGVKRSFRSCSMMFHTRFCQRSTTSLPKRSCLHPPRDIEGPLLQHASERTGGETSRFAKSAPSLVSLSFLSRLQGPSLLSGGVCPKHRRFLSGPFGTCALVRAAFARVHHGARTLSNPAADQLTDFGRALCPG